MRPRVLHPTSNRKEIGTTSLSAAKPQPKVSGVRESWEEVDVRHRRAEERFAQPSPIGWERGRGEGGAEDFLAACEHAGI